MQRTQTADSASAARRLNALAPSGRHELKIYGSGGHGTGLFNARVGLEQLLQEFVAKHL